MKNKLLNYTTDISIVIPLFNEEESLKDVKSTSKAFDIFPFGKIIKASLIYCLSSIESIFYESVIN